MSDLPPSDTPDEPSDADGGDGSDEVLAVRVASAGVELIEIQEEMERSFLDYAMSVITARALPDARDGLKPVHRRILWGMNELRAMPDRPTLKCARVTGEVMGKYHPHGNSAIYDAMVRMGQSFSLRHPLIHPKGNFGSLDDPPAAERYTESRLAQISLAMLEGIDEDTVDFADNYSGEFTEPVVLPSRFPNLLVNGSQGIAVGMATNIPPHNLGEVIDATTHLIDNPDATPDDLMEFVKGPDFPTGAYIMGRQGILDALRTGKGSIRLRGKAEIEEGARNDRIVITALPYQVSPNQVLTKVRELVESHELDGIADLNDESAKGELRLVIKLKKDAPSLVILNNLYKRTPLQTNFAVNTVALVDGIPRTLNLRDALLAYIDHQVEVIRRRTQFRLDKARARAHIVEGLIKALDLIDEIIAAIRASADKPAARVALMGEPFEFSEIQAEHILDMQLSRLTRLGRAQLEEEMAQLRATIAELEAILADEGRLRGVIKDEMGEIRAKFANPRRTEITYDIGDMDIEDLIDDEDLVLTMSAKGYVKTVAADAFRTQGRGGRGIAGARVKDEDYVSHIIHTTAHAYLLFFSSLGRVYRLKAHEIPMKDRTARGTAIINLLPLQPSERIESIIDTRDYETNRFLFFATKNGQVKKTKFNAYDSSLRAGLIAINLKEGDELVKVIPTNGGDDIFMVSKLGMTIRFNEDEVRDMGRAAAGVRGMKMKPGDEVVSCDVARDDTAILLVTDGGYGKRTQLDKFNPQGRGGQGVRGIKLTSKKGHVVAAFMVGLDDEIMLIASGGTVIRMGVRDISSQGRDATGVRVMNLDADQTVAAVAPVFGAEDDTTSG
jgi:DNA gyrase subunit A